MKNEKDSIRIYLDEIGRYDLLSKEEEKEYTQKYLQGDETFKEKLINSNLRLVFNIAKKFKNKKLPFKDLIQEGNIGLLKAINKFDGRERLSTYATFWIECTIKSAIYKERYETGGLSERRYKRFLQIQEEREKIKHLSFEEQIKNISKNRKFKKESVKDYLSRNNSGNISLDDEKNIGVVKRIPSTEKTPEQIFFEKLLNEELNRLLISLNIRDKKIIGYRFPLNGEEPLTLKETGIKLKVTRERIRQLQDRALVRLKNKRSSLKDYLYD